MNNTFSLFTGIVVATICPTTTDAKAHESQNNFHAVCPFSSPNYTAFTVSSVNASTAVFPNSFLSVQPPRKNYITAFKKMRLSRTMEAIYKNSSIGEIISVE